MKARFVNETSNIFKPKSAEDLEQSMESTYSFEELLKAAKTVWKYVGKEWTELEKSGKIALKILLRKYFNEKPPNFWLNLSVRQGYLEGVKKSIELGADINKNNGLALTHAINYRYEEIVQFLLDNGSKISQDAITNLSYVQSIPILKAVIKRFGMNFLKRDKDGFIIMAVNNHNKDFLKYLLQLGLNPNSYSLENNPLKRALGLDGILKETDPSIAQLLRKYGAKI